MVDSTASSRERDALEDGTGFDGMHMGTQATSPEGFFVGWTPGRVADPGRDDLAWKLEPGTDLVLQVHLRPTGVPEIVRPRIGLYLADAPPAEMPVVIMLENKELDIPAGDEAWVAEERFRTPVDVEALTIYPHAHYIGRRVRSWAELPSGGQRELLSIGEWDFNWQDQYRFAEAISIPAGSEIVMQWTFDNSADNPRNPNDPPKRVTFGPQSTDEMAELNIQVLPADPADRPALTQALGELYRAADAAFLVRSARQRGDEMARAGLWLDALEAYRAALREADDPEILQRMAAVIVAMGDAHGAVIVAERAVRAAPQSARALLTLARAYALSSRRDAARDAAERALDAARREGLDAVADSARAVLGRPR
jgi:tetratricopeptide (TPR) repeat protein